MPSPKEVFTCINNSTNNALRDTFGPPNEVGNEKLPALVAVALLQLSLSYFAKTGAPKQVVFEFFTSLMGIEGDSAKLEEKNGRLKIVPPEPSLLVVPKVVKG